MRYSDDGYMMGVKGGGGCGVVFFFFFKQKTAYEMCGRDWSSDVCSSDLAISGRIHSKADPTKCMDFDGGNTANGTNIKLAGCNDTESW